MGPRRPSPSRLVALGPAQGRVDALAERPERTRAAKDGSRLVGRTASHANYEEQYAKLPSYNEHWARSKKQRPPRWCQEKGTPPEMLGVDCEMCETDQDPRALVGVSVVNEKGIVLLKTLVKPPGKIVDYKTTITGLTAKISRE